MKDLFEVRDKDIEFYEKYLNDFLPDEFIDIHTHVWLEDFTDTTLSEDENPIRAVTWPKLVAKDNSIEDLLQTYKLMFPGKTVTPLIFGNPNLIYDLDKSNRYISACAEKYKVPALMLARPEMSGKAVLREIMEKGFFGIKVYLNYAKPYIPQNEIRIFDFVTHEQLEVLNDTGLLLMLHIPRKERLKDILNLMQLKEIEKRYPRVKLIVAHVGRAYCEEDIGNAFEVLSDCENMVFDISANCNSQVFKRLIKAVGPKRILFGSDMPILRMRSRRICENGRYVNLVEKGTYGDVSGDPNMREVSRNEAEDFTFFMYEEIRAFMMAAQDLSLNKDDILDIFNNNAERILYGGGSL